jgi:peptidoglycan/xylan/chitin deacetylase (PgdA/CDA1 family)
MTPPAHATNLPVLLYHSVTRSPVSPWTTFAISSDVFARHLDYLAEQGYTTLTITDALSRLRSGTLPARPVAITFDDGYANFVTAAMPALARRGFVASIFLVTGHIGGMSAWVRDADPEPLMTWDDVADICRQGIECGGHSHHHPYLDLLPLARARDEIARCKSELEDHLGRPIQSFAYPYGAYSQRVKLLVEQAGYTSAGAVVAFINDARCDPFALGRFAAHERTPVEALAAFLKQQPPAGVRTLAKEVSRSVGRVVRGWRQALSQGQKGGVA